MSNITIQQALKSGRENSKGAPEHIRNLEQFGGLAETFFSSRLGLAQYSDLRTHHVLDLIRDMEKRGDSVSYIRHVVNAVRLASNYMTDYHGIDGIKIEQRHLPARRETVKKWLTFKQIAAVCTLAMDTEQRQSDSKHGTTQPLMLGRLAVMACGLCGMRLTEFARLGPDCLDAGNNLTIGHGDSTTKNESSRRVIPIPALVADAMRDYWKTEGQWSKDRSVIGKRMRVVLRFAGHMTGDELLLSIAPKDMRKTLTNELTEDVDDKYTMAYGGWAFKGEMHRSYAALKPQPDGPQQVRDIALSRLRDKVLSVVENKITDLSF